MVIDGTYPDNPVQIPEPTEELLERTRVQSFDPFQTIDSGSDMIVSVTCYCPKV